MTDGAAIGGRAALCILLGRTRGAARCTTTSPALDRAPPLSFWRSRVSNPYNFPNSIAVNSIAAAFDPPLPARRPAGRRIDWNMDNELRKPKDEPPPRD